MRDDLPIGSLQKQTPNPIQRPVSRDHVSPRQKPNSDWGAARGTGKTNRPSLYNVKYRAHLALSSEEQNGQSVFIQHTRYLLHATPSALRSKSDPTRQTHGGASPAPPAADAIGEDAQTIKPEGSITSASEWWSQTGSNRRPPECKSGALPAELWPLNSEITFARRTSAARTPAIIRRPAGGPASDIARF